MVKSPVGMDAREEVPLAVNLLHANADLSRTHPVRMLQPTGGQSMPSECY